MLHSNVTFKNFFRAFTCRNTRSCITALDKTRLDQCEYMASSLHHAEARQGTEEIQNHSRNVRMVSHPWLQALGDMEVFPGKGLQQDVEASLRAVN